MELASIEKEVQTEHIDKGFTTNHKVFVSEEPYSFVESIRNSAKQNNGKKASKKADFCQNPTMNNNAPKEENLHIIIHDCTSTMKNKAPGENFQKDDCRIEEQGIEKVKKCNVADINDLTSECCEKLTQNSPYTISNSKFWKSKSTVEQKEESKSIEFSNLANTPYRLIHIAGLKKNKEYYYLSGGINTNENTDRCNYYIDTIATKLSVDCEERIYENLSDTITVPLKQDVDNISILAFMAGLSVRSKKPGSKSIEFSDSNLYIGKQVEKQASKKPGSKGIDFSDSNLYIGNMVAYHSQSQPGVSGQGKRFDRRLCKTLAIYGAGTGSEKPVGDKSTLYQGCALG